MFERLIQTSLNALGYRISRLPAYERYKPTEDDRSRVAPFLERILPAVQHNAATNTHPSPQQMKEYFTPLRLAHTRELLTACEDSGIALNGRRVLDVGCHAGYLLSSVRERFESATLHGCDVFQDKLKMAQAVCPDADLFLSSLQDLPDRQWDVIFLTEVLEHLVEPEVAVRRLLDAVPAGGHVVLTVPDGRHDSLGAKNHDPENGRYGGHIHFWSSESWPLFLNGVCGDCDISTQQLPTGQLFAAIRRPLTVSAGMR